MIDTLKFTQGDADWLKYRKRALDDLYWFCAVVLGYGPHVPMTEHAHRVLCRFVEGRTGHAALDDAHIRKLELPREWGKSTLITQGYTIQRLCADPNCSVMIANEKEQTAKDFLYAIKQQFQTNQLLAALFPEVIPKDFSDTTWSASRIVVNRDSNRKEPSVFVIGVGGTVTGLHPDVIIVDDMISREAMENARAGSWQIMHATNRWINQLYPLVNKNNPRWQMIFIGTRWWHQDSYEHIDTAYGYGEAPQIFVLRCKLPTGDTQLLPATRIGDLVSFRRQAIEHGRSAFPEKWDLDALAKMRLRDEALFAANMMNSPSDELTATFKESWLRYYEWLDEGRVTYTDGAGAKRLASLSEFDILMFVDPGGFAARQVEDRARAAIVVLGDDRRGNYLMLDVYSERDTFLACIEQLCSLTTRYDPRKIVIERVGQQAAFIELAKRALRDRGLQTVVDEVSPTKVHKEVRILGLEPYFQRGQLLVGRGPAFHEFRTQYTQFPRVARVDILDTLAYFPQFVRRAGGGISEKRRASERQADEVARYRARRGIA